MMSAGVVINHIMVQLRDYIKTDTAAEVKAVLDMNLCGYTFRKNENPTELSADTDATYEILLNYRDQLIIEGKAAATIENYGRELKKLHSCYPDAPKADWKDIVEKKAAAKGGFMRIIC